MKEHQWMLDKDGNVDRWRVCDGYHNGPECEVCGYAFCEHCKREGWDTECEF
jgi:hypothetical protein